MKRLLQHLTTILARLNSREQHLLAILLVLLITAGMYLLVVEPLARGRLHMVRRVETLRTQLDELGRLAERARALQAEVGRAQTAGGKKEFSLLSFVDKATSASVSADAVAAMSPSRRPLREGTEENLVELKLSGVALAELIALLRKIETAASPVYVKRLELKRRYDDHSRFDAVLLLGALSRT